MDIIKLDDQTYTEGKIINGLDSISWIERYNEAGEFEITAKPTAILMEDLYLGALISHIDSPSVMMVETYDIEEKENNESVIKITGRSVDEVAMENRVITLSDNENDPYDDDLVVNPFEYYLDEDTAWYQAMILMNRYLNNGTYDSQELIPNLGITNSTLDIEPVLTAKQVPKLSLLSTYVRDLLSSINAGLRIYRPGWDLNTLMLFDVHDGVDLSNEIQFNWLLGDLESIRYVDSIKNYKNSTYVSGQNYGIRRYNIFYSGLDLRIMPVEASDFTTLFATLPPENIAYIFSVLGARSSAALKEHKQKTIIDAKVSANSRYKFGVDYNIGDKVGVIGNYGISDIMRVTEYAITQDSEGIFGFPTLEPI